MPELAVISAHSATVEVWRSWALYLPPLGGIAAAGVAYSMGARRLHKRNRTAVLGRHMGAFYAGLATLSLSLLPPVDHLAEELFSAHMVQHLLIVLLASPLLVYGRPALPFALAAPAGLRRRITRLTRSGPGRTASNALFSPIFAGVAHAAALWVWHLPGPYQAALAQPALHAAEHLSFLATALLFWRFAIPAGSALRYLPATVLVLATGLQSSALGAILSFATFELYPAHASSAAAWGRTALQDQQLAGAIMWIPAGGVYLVTILVLLAKAFGDMEKRMTPQSETAPPPLIGMKGTR